MNAMDAFKTIIYVQLFFALGITLLTYALPDTSINHVAMFSDAAGSISLESVSSDVQDSLERQTNIPVVELGALVFYSGNILIDLLLNFAFAIPQMVGLVLNGIMFMFTMDTTILATVELFVGVLVMVMYLIGMIQLLTGVRSGRLV